jgi:hypothetical protein
MAKSVVSTSKIIAIVKMCRRARDLQKRAEASLNELLPNGTRVRVVDFGDEEWTGVICKPCCPAETPIICVRPDQVEEVRSAFWRNSVEEKGYIAVGIDKITVLPLETARPIEHQRRRLTAPLLSSSLATSH